MDCCPAQSKCTRISAAAEQTAGQHPKCSIPVLQTRKRRLCNELVCEVCQDIPVLGMSNDDILLTAFNVHTYLAERFRKKVIYRDAVAFVRAMREKEGVIARILINQVAHSNKGQHVLIRQQQSDTEFELRTNQLCIRMLVEVKYYNSRLSRYADDIQCKIDIGEDEVGNAHVHFFLRLIAPLLHPIALNLCQFRGNKSPETVVRYLNLLHNDWIQLSATKFLSTPINAELNKCNKLYITSPTLEQRFHRAFIQWLTESNNGQPKMCKFPYLEEDYLAALLAEINDDFGRAKNKCTFGVHIVLFHPTEETAPFIRRNNIGEQLEMRHKAKKGLHTYILIRRPIVGMDNNSNSKWMESDFGAIIASISVS